MSYENSTKELVFNVHKYLNEHRESHLQELLDLLRIPSISGLPEHKADRAQVVAWLSERAVTAGLEHVQVFPTEGAPILYGDWLHAGADKPTILIYGHYDVQPADPLQEWDTPPFEPTLKEDGRLYARGVADDKGQFYSYFKVVEAYLQANGRLPVNIKIIIEGEEEIGSAHLGQFLQEQADLLSADIALVSDNPIFSAEQPSIVYGLRGITYIFIDLEGTGLDLHSGVYGGGIQNPLNAAAHLISKLQDEDGRILIPGFYDQVIPLTAAERAVLAEDPLNSPEEEKKWLENAQGSKLWGEKEFTLIERTGARPTLDVHGIVGGYMGDGAKTVIPAKVQIKLSCRLVPNQDYREIGRLLEEYVLQIVPDTIQAKVTIAGGAMPMLAPYDTPVMQAAADAYEDCFGKRAIFTRMGGTLPAVSMFTDILGIGTVLMGFGLPEDRLHAPNESFLLAHYYLAMDTISSFFARYGELNHD